MINVLFMYDIDNVVTTDDDMTVVYENNDNGH